VQFAVAVKFLKIIISQDMLQRQTLLNVVRTFSAKSVSGRILKISQYLMKDGQEFAAVFFSEPGTLWRFG